MSATVLILGVGDPCAGLDLSRLFEPLREAFRCLCDVFEHDKLRAANAKLRRDIDEFVADLRADAAERKDFDRRTRERRTWPRPVERRHVAPVLPVARTASLRAFA